MITATQLAQEVAKSMPGWRAEEEEGRYFAKLVRDADGAKLTFYLDDDGKRVEVSPCWPFYADGSAYHPPEHIKITVSASRAGGAVAVDIERRLLVKYLPMYAAALSEVRDGDLRAKAANECRERLAKLVDGRLSGNHVYTDLVRSLRVDNGSSGPTVRMELYSVDELTAARILTVLKQLRDNSEPAEDAPEGAASATVGSGEEVG